MPAIPTRPSADALLAETQRHERGRLKVFLGAAPGVGKTFEMLSQARRKRAEGVDVVVGIVETHGRAETLALAHDLPQVARRVQEHRGRMLDELDLDALLERHPQLALVDELAHTNVPGSRHAKRHQDVQELLDAGIDVYTTLNVQHLESYNDLVQRITGVEVRETVPDSVLDLATDIELVDLPPDDLMERLRQGKVYVPAQAERALENFFTRGNLLALRELALRAAAAHIDDDLSNFKRAHGISQPWPTRGRLLVCIDATETSEDLLRSAKRLAEQRFLPWTALHVQTLGNALFPAAQRQLESNLALAAELGADSASITAERVGAGVLDYARTCNAAQIVLGRPRRGWRQVWRGSLASWLMRHATDFEVTVVAGAQISPVKRRATVLRPMALQDRVWGVTIVSVLLSTLLAAVLDRWVSIDDLTAVFLLGVVAAGAFGGLAAALLACALCFISYNFFFTEPRMTLAVSQAADLRVLLVFLAVGAVVGVLSGRLQRQAIDARRNTLRTAMLFDFVRRLASAVSEQDLRMAAAAGVQQVLGMRCLVMSAGPRQQLVVPAGAEANLLDAVDVAAANWCLEHQEIAGAGTQTLPAAGWCFVPVVVTGSAVGVMALDQRAQGGLDAEAMRVVFSLQTQLATAWERLLLLRHAESAQVQRAAENLRSALLASVSHDLRTPLVSVMGSLSSLHAQADQLSASDREQLLDMALQEAGRLDRLIQNLLDATRLAQGGLSLRLLAVPVDEVVRDAVSRLGEAQVRIEVDLPATVTMVRADRTLLEQVLVNLIENAIKYSPAVAPVKVVVDVRDDRVRFQVSDAGPGIAQRDQARVFDFFYRASAGDSGVSGSGLGLAICKGFVDAMGGSIRAHSAGSASGTTFVVELPLQPASPTEVSVS